MGWFWGIGLPAKKIVAYAPSIGNLLTSKNKWKALIMPYVGTWKFIKQAKQLGKFDEVCTRDIETKRMVQKVIRKDIPIVLDSTFLVDWSTCLKPVEVTDPYVLVYSYGLSKEIEEYVHTYAKENSCKVVTVSYLRINPITAMHILQKKHWDYMQMLKWYLQTLFMEQFFR